MSASAVPTGDQIRRAREALRMTQQDLADELGVGLRTVGRWERDESVPRSAIGALNRVLQLPVDSQPSGSTADRLLREASHVELLAEIARRLADNDSQRQFPALPPHDVEWYSRDAPSAHRIANSDESDHAKRSTR